LKAVKTYEQFASELSQSKIEQAEALLQEVRKEFAGCDELMCFSDKEGDVAHFKFIELGE
jgi:hypothetical protein